MWLTGKQGSLSIILSANRKDKISIGINRSAAVEMASSEMVNENPGLIS
jgi:hypothetical protein